LQEKDGKIKELTEQNEELKQKIERSREKKRKSQEENADRKRAKVNTVKRSIIKDKFNHIKPIGSNKTYGSVSLYQQSHYDDSEGELTPTVFLVKAHGRLEKLESILEIRYANNVSHKKIADPKVILYRSNKDECYIVLKIDDKNYGIVYGLKESFSEIEKKSFSVYEVSKDMKSFTDNVLRLIYVDNSGLYIVPAKENPIEQVKEKYKEKGQFDFRGSIIKVSAIDGSITWNGEPVTDDNFFDNGVEQGVQTALSTKQPNRRGILRNFYPPEGKFKGMYQSIGSFRNTSNWINSFVNIYLKNKAEGLVNNGKFMANLMTYLNCGCCKSELYSALADLLGISSPRNPGSMVRNNKEQFRDPDFVRDLKPIFEKIKKDCNHGTKFDDWSLFTIVKNL